MMRTSASPSKLAKMKEQFRIVAPSGQDKAAWLAMWPDYAGQNDLPDPAILEETWNRLQQSDSSIGGLFVKEAKTDILAGFLHYILHRSTWHTGQTCYIEDAYVLPAYRSRGAMVALYSDFIDKARAEGWKNIYWMTRGDNIVAQRFYDRITPKTNWVRYELDLKDGP